MCTYDIDLQVLLRAAKDFMYNHNEHFLLS